MSDDDQYREYGTSERDRQTPGCFRALVNAFSGNGNETRPTLTLDEGEYSRDEGSGEPDPELVGASVGFEDVGNVKTSENKVTDEKFSRGNSSESPGRISHSRPSFNNYDASGPGTILSQTDFRGGIISAVGHAPAHRTDLFDGSSLQREESSGGENFTGGKHSVRRSIGSIHNVTIRESKSPKDRPQDRDYRRTSFPTAHQF
jgi:hypothetical protein